MSKRILLVHGLSVYPSDEDEGDLRVYVNFKNGKEKASKNLSTGLAYFSKTEGANWKQKIEGEERELLTFEQLVELKLDGGNAVAIFGDKIKDQLFEVTLFPSE